MFAPTAILACIRIVGPRTAARGRPQFPFKRTVTPPRWSPGLEFLSGWCPPTTAAQSSTTRATCFRSLSASFWLVRSSRETENSRRPAAASVGQARQGRITAANCARGLLPVSWTPG
jgi:hypothetical protein